MLLLRHVLSRHLLSHNKKTYSNNSVIICNFFTFRKGVICNNGFYYNSNKKDTRWHYVFACAASLIGTTALSLYWKKIYCEHSLEPKPITDSYGLFLSDLPIYRKIDIEKHNNINDRIWVYFKNGVYDVTNFIPSHPGGKKIMLAAGNNLEPFFRLYAVHLSKHVMDTMEEHRIGNLHPDDLIVNEVALDSNDPFANDPVRSPLFKINSAKPFNAEPPSELLTQDFLTPNDIFFVRNHLPVPEVQDETHNVELSGKGINDKISFNLEELSKRYKEHTITAVIQCAGNRRAGMNKEKPVKGLMWGFAAISNAEWTGFKLADILFDLGITEDDVDHVIFQGADKDVEGIPYEVSIPSYIACDPRRDVLLAYKMNGDNLPKDHGFPLRVIVPGVVGARQCKWLTRIILSDEECQGHFQQGDYKVFNPSVDWATADFSKSPAIQEYPVQSAICEPKNGEIVDNAEVVTIKGYAWSGGGKGITRVDVSIDDGKTWFDADLTQVDQKKHRSWSWTHWEVDIDVPDGHAGPLNIVCKAVDAAHNVQPERAIGSWNIRGLINNAWHRIEVQLPEEIADS